MPSRTVITTQGQAWDQIALREYRRETMMGVLLPAPENVEQMDTLFFSGNVAVTAPETPARRIRAVRPWEKM